MGKKERHCGNCGEVMPMEVKVLPEKSIHYAECRCVKCGKHCGYLPYPKNEGKRTESSKYKPEDLGINSCQMCMRHGERLGNRETLEMHHIEEVQHGGVDEPENLWVLCTPCHRYVHHQRRYLNIHMQGRYTFEDLKEDMKEFGVPLDVQEKLKRIYIKQEAINVRLRN